MDAHAILGTANFCGYCEAPRGDIHGLVDTAAWVILGSWKSTAGRWTTPSRRILTQYTLRHFCEDPELRWSHCTSNCSGTPAKTPPESPQAARRAVFRGLDLSFRLGAQKSRKSAPWAKSGRILARPPAHHTLEVPEDLQHLQGVGQAPVHQFLCGCRPSDTRAGPGAAGPCPSPRRAGRGWRTHRPRGSGDGPYTQYRALARSTKAPQGRGSTLTAPLHRV